MTYELTDVLRLPRGPVSLTDHDAGSTPGFDGGKKEGKKALKALGPALREHQERMYADAYTGGRRRVLLALQGMDTSGKGGVIEHALGMLRPIGFKLTSFAAPTEEELAHDFLWRIDKALPMPGTVGVFDRSHYEDVLIVRVEELAPAEEVERRYTAINTWEKALVDDGVVVIKCMLHVSPEEQKQRLLKRLEKPHKHWKFKPDDVDARAEWKHYQAAYEIALERCNTEHAPWYVVPADHKWYERWAVATLLLEAFRGMRLEWPKPDYDIEEQRERLEKA